MLLMENAALEAFEGIDCSSPNAVVVGLAPSKFDYAIVGSFTFFGCIQFDLIEAQIYSSFSLIVRSDS